MGSFVLGMQLLLAAVFVTAGVAKLFDQKGTRTALEGFGIPERFVSVGGLLLPLAEIAIAFAVVVHPTARWGAVGAFLLLLGFVAGIARALARGESPDCHCFGQLHSAPAGPGALARNAALAVGAGIVAVHGSGPPIQDWVSARSPAELVAVGAGIAAIALGVACVRLWLERRGLQAELSREREASGVFPPGLPVGAAAPSFELPGLKGEKVALDALMEPGRALALVFLSPSCDVCATLLPDLGRWQAALADRITIAVISTGSREDNRALKEEHGLANVLLQDGAEVMTAYRMRGTPAAVIVGADGRIASVAAAGAAAVEPLIRLALRSGVPEASTESSGGNGAPEGAPALSIWRSA